MNPVYSHIINITKNTFIFDCEEYSSSYSMIITSPEIIIKHKNMKVNLKEKDHVFSLCIFGKKIEGANNIQITENQEDFGMFVLVDSELIPLDDYHLKIYEENPETVRNDPLIQDMQEKMKEFE